MIDLWEEGWGGGGGDIWCNRMEEVVAVQLVDRLVLAGCKPTGVEELGK